MTEIYEPPAMTELGEFEELTSGVWTDCYYDWVWRAYWAGC